jgi:hydroxymethylbilane synthase
MARLPLRIGTRASPLALTQAAAVRARLALATPELAEAQAVEIVPITTTGDTVRDRKLMEIGGKGLFTKEIEEALLAGAIDMAVHSMKDMPTFLPEGLAILALLPREDPRDALLVDTARLGAIASIAALPQGATVGTASLRRQALLLHLRPDLRIVPLRGNVETRLRKLKEGQIDATLLAVAGLKRLGLAEQAQTALDPLEMLPAVAQGAIGIEARLDDSDIAALLASIDDQPTRIRVTAERAMLAVLDGSCRTPIGGLATLAGGDVLELDGLVVMPDGTSLHRTRQVGSPAEAEAIGRAIGEELRRCADPAFFRYTG